MLGVLANTVAVVIGSLIGILFSGLIKEEHTNALMCTVGLCTIYIGIDGALKGENTLVLILSLVLGTILGALLDLDGCITRIGKYVERKFSKKKNGKASVAEGFMTASMLFCIGSMTVVGSLEAGIHGDNTVLFTKSVLDFFSACVLASSLGIGVLCSAAYVFFFQGTLVALAKVIAPLLSTAAQAEMICAGSVMIIGLGLNLLGVTKLKIANMLPALLLAPLLTAPLNAMITAVS